MIAISEYFVLLVRVYDNFVRNLGSKKEYLDYRDLHKRYPNIPNSDTKRTWVRPNFL